MSGKDLPLVIVSHQLPAAWLDSLRDKCRLLIGPETKVTSDLTAELAGHLPAAVGLLTILTVQVNDDLLTKAPKLRVVSNMAVGVDNIDLAACTRRGIPVGHTPGVLTEGTADLTMALLLSVARKVPEASAYARGGQWTTWEPDGWLGADLAGSTVGIVGLGKIGTAVARRAKAFGVDLVYTSNSRKEAIEEELGARFVSLEELLQVSDFVCLHVPLTPVTHRLIDERALRLMKPTAILINVARGPVVDPRALFRALTEHWIAAAGLDVTEPEPLPSSDPLYGLPNCLVLPHIGSATVNTRRRMAELACANILAGLVGERLPHPANPAVYEK